MTMSLKVKRISSIIEVAIKLLLIFTSSAYGDIRCYCNHPVCVRTGYMCKSSGANAACYSEHLAFGTIDTSDKSRHGCIELLPLHMKPICEAQVKINPEPTSSEHDHRGHHHPYHNRPHQGHHSSGNSGGGGGSPSQRTPSLICCSDDMCNYVSKLDMNIQVHIKSNNHSQGGEVSGGDLTPSTSSADTLPDLWWFRIAVIAVPIAGSFVLVFLILLATRVLRQDTKRQRHLSELRRQRQFKTDLLLNGGIGKRHYNDMLHDDCNRNEQRNVDKNQANAKINDLENNSNASENNPVYSSKDINISLPATKDSNVGRIEKTNSGREPVKKNERVFVYDKLFNTSLYSSLLSWGKWDNANRTSSNNPPHSHV